jgi:hypothetical protein
MNNMKVLVKRIEKDEKECYPFESGWVTVIVGGENLNEDSVGEFLYSKGVNVGDYSGAPGQYYQHTYFRMNPNQTRAKIRINFGYDV